MEATKERAEWKQVQVWSTERKGLALVFMCSNCRTVHPAKKEQCPWCGAAMKLSEGVKPFEKGSLRGWREWEDGYVETIFDLQ